jgi:hypothetical protein
LSDNGTDKKEFHATMTLRLRKDLKLEIDADIPANDVALNMIDQARREFEFRWNMQRGFAEQQRMQNEAKVQSLIHSPGGPTRRV